MAHGAPQRENSLAATEILIVEDEPKLAELLRDYLKAAGYAAAILDDGAHALARIRERAPAAVLLDLMLPGMDGLRVCREVRAFSSVPILMITARVEEIDRLLGLELGADDYICKPFGPREVVARVKAVLRRAQPAELNAPPPLRLDEERLEARLHGVALNLTPVEFRLLQALHARPGRVMSRANLIDALYLDHRVVSDRTVDSHIKNLRRKIADAGGGIDPIVSVYGMGYKIDWDAGE
ncbi:MAG: response regulator [Lysobacteraceae bacterium]|nr:MAG: response regulator [Xanthomonadaceae bacterium]